MRLLTITAAIAALSFGASASAASVSFSVSSDADRTEKASKSRSVFDIVVQSTMTAFDLIYTAGDKQDEDMVLRFYQKNETCESQTAAESETEAEPEEKKALAGPEPIYFGF